MIRWFLAILFICFCFVVTHPLSAQVNVDLTKQKAQLLDPDPAQRVVAIQEIARSYDRTIGELLLPMLRDTDARVRAAAAKGVEFNATGEVQQVLLELLQDPDIRVRGAAARSYGGYHFDLAIEPLTKLLTDPAPEVRAGAISGLGKIRHLNLLDPLMKGMADPAPQVRAAAARAVEDITQLQNWTTAPDDWHYQFQQATPDKASATLKKACRWDEIVAGLMSLQKDQDVTVRANATIALSKFDKDITAERLLEALSLPDAKVRADFMWACHKLYDIVRKQPAVLDAVCAAFSKEKDPDARWAIALRLGNAQDNRAIPSLKAALNEENPRVLAEIIRALYSLHDPSAAEDLLPFVHHANPQVRAAAIAGLGYIQQSPAMEDLCLQALQDPDKAVCSEAISALGQLKSRKAIKPLVAFLQTGDESILWPTISALGNIGDPQALDGLLAFKTTDENVYCSLIYALIRYKDPRVEAKIFTALQEGNSRVQDTAFYALQQLSSTEAVARLVAIMLQDSSVNRRRMAAQTLSRRNDPRLGMSFVATLKDADIEVRRTAVNGLAQLHDPRMIKPLLQLAQAKNEPDSNIRRQALQIVLSYDAIPAECNSAFIALLKDANAEIRRLSAAGVKRYKIPLQ